MVSDIYEFIQRLTNCSKPFVPTLSSKKKKIYLPQQECLSFYFVPISQPLQTLSCLSGILTGLTHS